jgi:hypothetical protein
MKSQRESAQRTMPVMESVAIAAVEPQVHLQRIGHLGFQYVLQLANRLVQRFDVRAL